MAILLNPKPKANIIDANVQVISIACCVFYSHCGNRAILREKLFEKRNSWGKNMWSSKLFHMHEFKEQVCTSWFAPVGSANDYPLLSKWVIYGEVLLDLGFRIYIYFIYFIFITFYSFSARLQWIM